MDRITNFVMRCAGILSANFLFPVQSFSCVFIDPVYSSIDSVTEMRAGILVHGSWYVWYDWYGHAE